MYLSVTQTKTLGHVMRTLAEPHEEAEIRSRVGELMLDLLDAQFYASYVWNDAGGAFQSGVQLHMNPANLQQYEDYFQFHDPITPAMQRHRRAVLVSEVLPRNDLLHSEFFNDFLAKGKLHWGVNLFAWDGTRNIGDMRIWRDRKRTDFGAGEKQILDLVRPAFVAALRRCQPDTGLKPSVGKSDISAALASRAVPTVLSEREQQVAELVACGLADKEIARRLSISLSTVRTHMRHAFRKLGVDNRLRLAQRLGH